MNEIDAIVSLWGKDCLLDEDGTLSIEGRSPTAQERSEIQTEILRLQAEYDSLEYARLRKAEYDQLNQFEMQFDDQRDGTTTWVDAINSIKARFPK
jgi:hypothetical protein